MIKISPSILSADFANLGRDCRNLCDNKADLIHIDVMDGCFVPNITLGAPIIKAIKPYCDVPLDVHLMINEPERYIDDFIKAGADIITVHCESTTKLDNIIKKLNDNGIKSSIAIKPNTPCEEIYKYLPLVSMVLVMTVEPGFGGQALIESTISKVETIKNKCKELAISPDIEVDGGITLENISRVSKAGANVIVAGSTIFKADDMKEIIKKLRDNAEMTSI